MKDMLGNTVKAGDKVFWTTRSLHATVIDATDGGISIVERGTRELTPGKLILRVEVQVNPNPQDPGANLLDFLCVRDPAAEEKIDRILSKEPACPQTKPS